MSATAATIAAAMSAMRAREGICTRVPSSRDRDDCQRPCPSMARSNPPGPNEDLEAELGAVLAAVLRARVLDAPDVRARLGEGDRVDGQRLVARAGLGDPAVDVALAAVVGSQCERLVAGVAVEQVAQVERAV